MAAQAVRFFSLLFVGIALAPDWPGEPPMT